MSVTLDEFKYGYDVDSNRLWKANSTTTGLDEFYTYDPLNRLTKMQRGVLNSTKTGITGTPVREMDYTLDPLGNWDPYVTKTSGSTNLNQTRTHNTVNEITAIGGTPAWATPPAHDAAGNMTSFPQPDDPTATAYTAVYDAWNRLVQVSAGSDLVAQYQYDGMNRRTVKKTYTGVSTLLSTRHYYYSSNWQDLEERVDTSSSANFQYVWGVRYVDELVCRDYISTSGSSSSGSPMPPSPSRLYAFQDANFNLTGICDASGTVLERYAYDPYGNRIIYNGSWSPLTSSAYSWVIGHQGLMLDVETGLIYNRNRMLHPELGRFLQRDPIGYGGGGLNLYESEESSPVDQLDPSGLACCNGQPYDPSTQCCENNQVVGKVPIWQCTRPLHTPKPFHLITHGIFVGIYWGIAPIIPGHIKPEHEYLCCDGPNNNCHGLTEGQIQGKPVPAEVDPTGRCSEKMVCPSEKKSKCNNPIAPWNYHALPFGPNSGNCQSYGCLHTD